MTVLLLTTVQRDHRRPTHHCHCCWSGRDLPSEPAPCATANAQAGHAAEHSSCCQCHSRALAAGSGCDYPAAAAAAAAAASGNAPAVFETSAQCPAGAAVASASTPLRSSCCARAIEHPQTPAAASWEQSCFLPMPATARKARNSSACSAAAPWPPSQQLLHSKAAGSASSCSCRSRRSCSSMCCMSRMNEALKVGDGPCLRRTVRTRTEAATARQNARYQWLVQAAAYAVAVSGSTSHRRDSKPAYGCKLLSAWQAKHTRQGVDCVLPAGQTHVGRIATPYTCRSQLTATHMHAYDTYFAPDPIKCWRWLPTAGSAIRQHHTAGLPGQTCCDRHRPAAPAQWCIQQQLQPLHLVKLREPLPAACLNWTCPCGRSPLPAAPLCWRCCCCSWSAVQGACRVRTTAAHWRSSNTHSEG
ncbi:hypothetical protein COO60DRAFT_507909 [Scenedesmus sp. NREL 46B-D3]|nr:hypothetical protein COO60DRAFT_507909 [Scenedesmus sp. NREL 46B-D3]